MCLRNVLLRSPHDVQGKRVDPRRKFLFRLDQRNFFPSVQIFDHHAGKDFLSYNNASTRKHRHTQPDRCLVNKRFAEEGCVKKAFDKKQNISRT